MSLRETMDELGLPDTMNMDSADLFASATEVRQGVFMVRKFCHRTIL